MAGCGVHAYNLSTEEAGRKTGDWSLRLLGLHREYQASRAPFATFAL